MKIYIETDLKEMPKDCWNLGANCSVYESCKYREQYPKGDLKSLPKDCPLVAVPEKEELYNILRSYISSKYERDMCIKEILQLGFKKENKQ